MEWQWQFSSISQGKVSPDVAVMAWCGLDQLYSVHLMRRWHSQALQKVDSEGVTIAL